MQRVSILLVILAACDGGDRFNDDGTCPVGETCSPAVTGLEFVGESPTDLVFTFDLLPTAVNGTQDITLEYRKPQIGMTVPLDLPYTTDDNGGPGVVVDSVNGPTVTVHGIAPNANYLRILDPDGTLYDRKVMVAAEIDSIALVSSDLELPPAGETVVFASGDARIVVALKAASGDRLVDSSMTLAMDGASRIEWDTVLLAGATAGTRSIVVTAGDRSPATLDVIFVDGADAIDAIDPPATVPVGSLSLICFAARNAGRFVTGFSDWAITTDNGKADDALITNCVALTPAVAGPVHLTVHAGGMTVPFTMTATAQVAPVASPERRVRSTAGERAANTSRRLSP